MRAAGRTRVVIGAELGALVAFGDRAWGSDGCAARPGRRAENDVDLREDEQWRPTLQRPEAAV